VLEEKGVLKPCVFLQKLKIFVFNMNNEITNKIIYVCDDKISKKGENVGLSFYAFFKNKNDNSVLLMEIAK
jgi:hypothetical protein